MMRDCWRRAALLFAVVSLIKLFYTSFGIRLMISPVPAATGAVGLRRFLFENQMLVGAAVALAYFASAAFCFFIATALQQKREWAIRVGQIYGIIQVLSIFFIKALGVLGIVNFVFGVMLLVTLGLIDEECDDKSMDVEHVRTSRTGRNQ